MDCHTDRAASVTAWPPVPERGLAEVLRSWRGEGEVDALLAALARVAAPTSGEWTDVELEWSANDVRRRANRVLFGLVIPLLTELPLDVRDWIDVLPAQSTSHIEVSRRPLRSTSWPRTFRRFGWPPSEFLGRVRESSADEVLVSLLRWAARTVPAIRADAVSLAAAIDRPVAAQLNALHEVAELPLMQQGPLLTPDLATIEAAARAGAPWNTLAPLADALLRLSTSAGAFATEVVRPDESLAWRLFHLGVFGELLAEYRQQGWGLVSLAPLSGGASRPSYRASKDGAIHDLWFEASGIWRYYRRFELNASLPYRQAVSAAASSAGALTPDVVVVAQAAHDPRVAGDCLIIECKSSIDAASAARDGYQQVIAYALEARATFAPAVEAYVVGAEGAFTGVTSTPSFEHFGIRHVGAASATCTSEVLINALAIAASDQIAAAATPAATLA